MCGQLSPDATCKQCHLKKERQRDRIRDADPVRQMKKATLYDYKYRKQAMLLKTRGGICYLCGEVVPADTGHDNSSTINSDTAYRFSNNRTFPNNRAYYQMKQRLNDYTQGAWTLQRRRENDWG